MNYLPRVALAPSFAPLLPCRSTLFLPSTADDDGKRILNKGQRTRKYQNVVTFIADSWIFTLAFQ